MKVIIWKTLNKLEQKRVLSRPASSNQNVIRTSTIEIINAVKKNGDKALYELTEKYDKAVLDNLIVSPDELELASRKLNPDAMDAINLAISRITNYHKNFLPDVKRIDTMDGVTCERIPKPIQSVGLYVPGGTAPLVSTLMMLAIPAQIANCSTKLICTPPDKNGEIDPYLLYTAKLCGIRKVFKVGGAQAIAAMAYGTETIPKVNKIYGPGNAWVTEAKLIVSKDPEGASIDLPAGPSEVMVIADRYANPLFIAADLLSQAEHGKDSQVLLIQTSTLALKNQAK